MARISPLLGSWRSPRHLPFHGFFGSDLQIEIDGQLKILAGSERLSPSSRNTFPRLLTSTRRLPFFPFRYRVCTSSRCRDWPTMSPAPAIEARITVQRFLRDLAHISDDVRHEPVSRIEAAVRGNSLEFRQLIAMRFDERNIGRSQIVFEDQGSDCGGWRSYGDVHATELGER